MKTTTQTDTRLTDTRFAELASAARALSALLDSMEPGLISWHECLAKRVEDIQQLFIQLGYAD